MYRKCVRSFLDSSWPKIISCKTAALPEEHLFEQLQLDSEPFKQSRFDRPPNFAYTVQDCVKEQKFHSSRTLVMAGGSFDFEMKFAENLNVHSGSR